MLSAFSLFIEEGKFSIQTIKNFNDPPEEKLRKSLYLFIEEVQREGIETFELMFDFWSIGLKERKYRSDFYKYLKDFYTLYREVFTEIIRDGQKTGVFRKNISPENIGAMIIGMLDGLMAQWILDKKNVNYIEVVKTMSDIIISGLKEG